MQTQDVMTRAEKLLSETFGQMITLQLQSELTSGHLVLRCSVMGCDGLNSVIVKQVVLDDVKESQRSWFQQRFLNECATLQFLNSVPNYTARWIAGEIETGLFIVEDLGVYPSIQDLLLAQESEVAAQSLKAYAATLGQFQAATVGKEPEFKAIRETVTATTPYCDGNYDIRTALPTLFECLDTLQVTRADGFETELMQVAAAIHDEQTFRALCHCDAGMHNMLWLGDGGVRLLDFEFAQYQHALTDIVCARMGYPPAFHGYPVPPALVTEMEAIYRAELVKAIPAASDDTLFYDGLVQTCAQWTFSELTGIWRVYLKPRLEQGESYDSQNGKTTEGSINFLRRLMTYLRAFVECAETYDRLPALRTTFAGVIEALLRHWDVIESLPYFPAFVEITK